MPGYNHYPNCACGWCIGGWRGVRLGRSPAALIALSSAGATLRWNCGDFCQPTTCPVCNVTVYFVRYNGGSVWFDQLGKPWPRHSCFGDDASGSNLRLELRREVRSECELVFGVIVAATVIEPGKSGELTIRTSEGTDVVFTFEVSDEVTSWAGTLMLGRRTKSGEVVWECVSTPSRIRRVPTPILSREAWVVWNGRKYLWNGKSWIDGQSFSVAPREIQATLNALVEGRLKARLQPRRDKPNVDDPS